MGAILVRRRIRRHLRNLAGRFDQRSLHQRRFPEHRYVAQPARLEPRRAIQHRLEPPQHRCPAGFTALSTRPETPTLADLSEAPTIAITIITGNRDSGVTLAGRATAGTIVTVADAAGGQTALIGSTTVGSNGRWSLTSHAKINVATINTYTASTTDGYGNVGAMPGALILADTGTDSIVARASVAKVAGARLYRRKLLDSIDTSTLVGLRNRALISVMTFVFARIGAVIVIRVEDFP